MKGFWAGFMEGLALGGALFVAPFIAAVYVIRCAFTSRGMETVIAMCDAMDRAYKAGARHD